MLVGALYLAFGLLPVIVMHFVFDVVWFALPLFASSAPGIWIDRSLVIALALVPLWVVFYARWRHGRWEEVPDRALNRAWSPAPEPERRIAPEIVAVSRGLGQRTQLALYVLGLAGLAVWIGASSFTGEIPTFPTSQSQATRAARHALEQRGITLDDDWRELASVDGQVNWRDRFVWQKGGAEAYRKLLGNHLSPPRWRVRYARFEGNVAERAEEYNVWVDGEGSVRRFRHVLPEARDGESLDEEEARALAHKALADLHGLDPKGLEEVSAEPDKQPARRDWELVFKNPAAKPGGEGEARISVRIAGDEVVDSFLFVHVPEEWRRNETARLTAVRIVTIGTTAVMVLLFVVGGVVAIVRWSRGRFATKTFLAFLAVLAGLRIAALFNEWPTMSADFQTQMAFGLQAALALGVTSAEMLVIAAVTALNIGLIHRLLPIQPPAHNRAPLAGAALGAVFAGLAALASAWTPDTVPTWANVKSAGTLMPLFAIVANPLVDWLVRATLLLLVLGVAHAATSGWTRRRVPVGAVIILVGLMLAGSQDVETIPLWLGGGLATGIAVLASYVLVLRFHLALVPVTLAVMTALGALREGIMRGTPLAFPGAVLAVVLLLTLGYIWARWLTRDRARD
jgi:hypothetical protein